MTAKSTVHLMVWRSMRRYRISIDRITLPQRKSTTLTVICNLVRSVSGSVEHQPALKLTSRLGYWQNRCHKWRLETQMLLMMAMNALVSFDCINPLMHIFTKWSHVSRYLSNKTKWVFFSESVTTFYALCIIKGLTCHM